MKRINIHTYIVTFILLFVLATICSLLGNANDNGTLVFTPATEFLMKLHTILKYPTDATGYSGFVKGIYGIIGGILLNVLLYSFAFERFVSCVKSIKQRIF